MRVTFTYEPNKKSSSDSRVNGQRHENGIQTTNDDVRGAMKICIADWLILRAQGNVVLKCAVT